GDEYLGLGMTDALITRLARLRNLAVRPTSAVGKYGDWPADRAGRELRVDAVLEGTVQRADGNVRVAVQLVRVAHGRTIWADHSDEPVTSAFELQDSIAVKIAQVLPLKLSGDDAQRLASGSTRNAAAYQLYLQGRYFWSKRTQASVAKAAELF